MDLPVNRFEFLGVSRFSGEHPIIWPSMKQQLGKDFNPIKILKQVKYVKSNLMDWVAGEILR